MSVCWMGTRGKRERPKANGAFGFWRALSRYSRYNKGIGRSKPNLCRHANHGVHHQLLQNYLGVADVHADAMVMLQERTKNVDIVFNNRSNPVALFLFYILCFYLTHPIFFSYILIRVSSISSPTSVTLLYFSHLQSLLIGFQTNIQP